MQQDYEEPDKTEENSILIEQWYNWIRLFIFQTVPRRKRHRSQLSHWVSQTTSNPIKKLFTVKRNQPGNYEKIKLMQRSCERTIEQDRANFESRLANKIYKQAFQILLNFQVNMYSCFCLLYK